MRFYKRQHEFYCGIDLHAKTMHICLVNQAGETLVHRNLPTQPERFLSAIADYRQHDLVVAAECMFTWYWLADLCAQENIPFVLGHALYMKAIHGGKTKNDRVDSEKIAMLLRGGMLPEAYVYPQQMRATRDLLRRRMYLMHHRSEAIAHIVNTASQYNLPELGKRLTYAANREGVAELFHDPSTKLNIETDLALIDHFDQQLRRRFLSAIADYRQHDLVVAAECMFTWYWLADLCAQENIPFVLGHALYMKAIHGGKTKNDRVDSEKIAMLLRGGMLPEAYVYPQQMRATRDLLRRRMYLMHHRSEAIAHIVNTASQYNLPELGKRLTYAANREGVAELFHDPSTKLNIETDLALIDHFDQQLRRLELHLSRSAKVHDPQSYYLLRSIPGVGKILALVLLYEIHNIRRFAKVGRFLSYARLVRCPHESAGKRTGSGKKKIGNPHLKWAFSETTILLLRQLPAAKEYVEVLTKKHAKAQALAMLATRLGRTVYLMLRRKEPFDANRFLKT